MSHSQRYALWMYEDVKTIKEDKLYLVRNKQTEELAVKRYIRKELIPDHGHKARIKTIHGSRWLKFGTKVAYKYTKQWIKANVENRCKASSRSTGNVITEVK